MVLGYYFPNAFSKFLYSRLIKSTAMSFVFKVPPGGVCVCQFAIKSELGLSVRCFMGGVDLAQ